MDSDWTLADFFGVAYLHWMTEKGARIAASCAYPDPAIIREWATQNWVEVDSDGHRR